MTGRPLKICHAIGTLDPAEGGPPVVAPRLAAAQAHLGHQVTITAFEKPQRQQTIDTALRSIPHLASVDIAYLPQPHNLWQRVLARHVRTDLDRLVGSADVVHLHGLWDPLLRVTAGRALRLGTPYVVRPAGMLDPWSLAQKRFKKKIAMAVVFRRILNQALFVHALNQQERELIGPLKIGRPIEVIPNGLFVEEVDAPAPDRGYFSRHPQLKEKPFFIFLSRLHYKKGLDILADAFGQFVARGGSMDLVVAGPDAGARQDFERRVHRLGLDTRVHLTGPIYGADKIEMLRHAAGFVLPSRQEGFSMAITEAMASGLPVIITENCHFPEVAQVGAGWVTELGAEPIARAMLGLAADPAAATAMGRAARQLVEARYTWAGVAEQTLQAYRRYLDPQDPEPAGRSHCPVARPSRSGS